MIKNIFLKKSIYLAVFIALSIFIAKDVTFFYQAYYIDFEEPARDKLHLSARLIDSAFTKARLQSGSIAGKLTLQSIEKEAMKRFMTSVADSFPIDGLLFAVESAPGAAKTPQNNYALLLSKQTGFINMGNFFKSNTTRYHQWYRKTFENGQAWWTNPVFDEMFGVRIVGCCVPFDLKGGEKRNGVGNLPYRPYLQALAAIRFEPVWTALHN